MTRQRVRRGLRAACRRLARDRRGAITLLAAAGMVMVMAGGALAVDLGSVFYESRRLQGIADAAALAAAANPAAAGASARAAIDAAGWQRAMTPAITLGTWTADPTRSVAQRFVAGAGNANAAQVRLTADTPLYFGRMFGMNTLRIARSATAARLDLASFSIGSRLLGVDAGIANALLGKLTGCNVALTAADYDALLTADVDLLDYVSALRTETGLTAVSFDRMLATPTTLPHALAALRDALARSGDAAAGAAIAKLVVAGPVGTVLPATLVSLGRLGGQDHVATGGPIGVGGFAMLAAILQAANGTRQIDLDLGATAANLATLGATLVIGERRQDSPWIAVTDTGAPIVSTAQIRLYLQATALASPALAAFGIGPVRLPLYVEIASAQARLSSLTCGAGVRRATLEAQASIGHAAIADVNPNGLGGGTPVESAATIVNLPGVARITGTARVDLGDSGGWQTIPYEAGDIDAQAIKRVHARDSVGAVAASLAGQLALTATTGPLSIATPTLGALAKPFLLLMAPALDKALTGVLDLLGVRLGEADVRMNGVRCGSAALVA